MSEIKYTHRMFEAQRRCSDLNSAVYKYYDNIKKRCLNGEKVSYSDLDVLNLRQCFREFSLEAYPELVVLVWPEYARPEANPDNVRVTILVSYCKQSAPLGYTGRWFLLQTGLY